MQKAELQYTCTRVPFSLVSRLPSLFIVAHEKQERLGDKVTCNKLYLYKLIEQCMQQLCNIHVYGVTYCTLLYLPGSATFCVHVTMNKLGSLETRLSA